MSGRKNDPRKPTPGRPAKAAEKAADAAAAGARAAEEAEKEQQRQEAEEAKRQAEVAQRAAEAAGGAPTGEAPELPPVSDRRSSSQGNPNTVEAKCERAGVPVVFMVRSCGGDPGTQAWLTPGPALKCPDDGRGKAFTIAGRKSQAVVLTDATAGFLAAALADDRVDVTVPGSRQPWPRSAADRNAKPPHRDYKRPKGDSRPFPGPNYMARLEADGHWPTRRDLGWMAYHGVKALDPERAFRALYSDQGLEGVEREVAVRRAMRRLEVGLGGSGDAPDFLELFQLQEERDAKAADAALGRAAQ